MAHDESPSGPGDQFGSLDDMFQRIDATLKHADESPKRVDASPKPVDDALEDFDQALKRIDDRIVRRDTPSAHLEEAIVDPDSRVEQFNKWLEEMDRPRALAGEETDALDALEDIDNRLDAVNHRGAVIDSWLENVDGRIEQRARPLDGVSGSFDNIDQRLDAVAEPFVRLEEQLDGIDAKLRYASRTDASVESRAGDENAHSGHLSRDLQDLMAELDAFDVMPGDSTARISPSRKQDK